MQQKMAARVIMLVVAGSLLGMRILAADKNVFEVLEREAKSEQMLQSRCDELEGDSQ